MAAWLERLTGSTSVRARLARAMALMLAGTGLQQFFGMVASIVVARILGKTLFGEFGLIRSTTLMFASLAGAGLGLAATRYIAELRIADPVRTGRVARFLMLLAWYGGLALTLICAALAKPIAAKAMDAEQLALPLAVSSLAIVLSAVTSVQTGVISGCEAFRPFAVITAVEGLVSGVLIVAGAWTYGVLGATAGYVGGLCVAYLMRRKLMIESCAKASIPLQVSGAGSEWPLVTAFIIPALITALGTQPAEWLARVLLARGPEGLAEVGLFTAAFAWAQLVLFIPTQLAGPAMPILTNVLASGDVRAFQKAVIESAGVAFVVAGAAAVVIAVASPWIMSLYGRSFRSGAIVLACVVFAQAIGAVHIMFRVALLAAARVWLQASLIVLWGVCLLGSFVLLGRFRAWTLAASYGIAFAVVALVELLVVIKGRMFRAPVSEPAGGHP